MKFCPECGSKLTSESAKFCSECGFRLSNLLPEANEKASNTCNLNENSEPELGEFEKSMCFFEYTEEPDESYVIQRCIDDFAKTILVFSSHETEHPNASKITLTGTSVRSSTITGGTSV